MQEEKQMERRKKIAVELSDLVVYCRPVPFNEDSKGFSYLTVFNISMLKFVLMCA